MTTTARHEEPPVREGGRVWRWLLNGAALTGILAVLIALAVVVVGGRVIIFSSGSMAPAIPTGSVALTVPHATDELSIGDVISVPRPGDGRLVTHRVTALTTHEGVVLATLRGDANPEPDAAPYALGARTDLVVFAVPAVGSLLSAMKSPWILWGVLALVVVAAIPARPSAKRPKSGVAQ